MFNYFYHFFNKRLAQDIFTRNEELGSPSPPTAPYLLFDNGDRWLTESGNQLIGG